MPPELRVKVYRYLLLDARKGPIEIWPACENPSTDEALKIRARRYLSWYTTSGLLHVCRLIHMEAAQVLYGESDFRFSGVNGHVVANAFIAGIGSRNARYLKYLTIGMPFWAKDRPYAVYDWKSRVDTAKCLKGSLAQIEDLEDMMPWKYPKECAKCYTYSWDLLSRALVKAGNLKELTLILPEWFEYYNGRDTNQLWSALDHIINCLPGLTLKVIYVCRVDAHFKELSESQKRLVRDLHSSRVRIFRLADYNSSLQEIHSTRSLGRAMQNMDADMLSWKPVVGKIADDFERYIDNIIADPDD
ncbi:hypothetical protein K491DRAFT_340324 [Lophiostoma macrostomum CBS 122681]|uniref:Uncharacterized protein n=1 Tax=Lophiostoma macrostomum CBS 122681 TaxID=1314788 RepID=A0A6A6TTY0_9PLEO|nr:hypothetical protein K491DRAFT_340324 [Lophiostoma macrostomum CBS 122681]